MKHAKDDDHEREAGLCEKVREGVRVVVGMQTTMVQYLYKREHDCVDIKG